MVPCKLGFGTRNNTKYLRDDGPWQPVPSGISQTDADARYVKETDHTKAAHDSLLIDAATPDGIDSTGFAPAPHVGASGTGAHPNPTTSASGFQSAPDKTKLNGVETGATADMTAAEILAALAPADGAGSGLDADAVDGRDSSYLLDRANRLNEPQKKVPRLTRVDTQKTSGGPAVEVDPVDPQNPRARGDPDGEAWEVKRGAVWQFWQSATRARPRASFRLNEPQKKGRPRGVLRRGDPDVGVLGGCNAREDRF